VKHASKAERRCIVTPQLRYYMPMKTLYISQFNGKDWDISDKPVTE
jgi:hypothetical protein